MGELLIKNIKGLVQVRTEIKGPLRGKDMAELPVLENAFLVVANGRIARFGPMSELGSQQNFRSVIDATDRFVFPSFIDSHTHIIFPATREDEFVMKIQGASYADIASKGGGILNSARKLNQTSQEALRDGALMRLHEITATGTGCVEIKSGYGLTLDGELKMLRVAKELQRISPLKIRTTFLGAHAFPKEISRQQYIELVVNEMIPAVASEQLADYIDVFCEEGFFTFQESERIINAGIKAGMKPRIHANQLSRSGGVQLGVKLNAISVDHLENIGDEEISLLAKSNVLATALPGAAFFLNLPMPPARALLNANAPLVIASDYNPGSSPSGNMLMMISLACIRMKITPEEAINAATVNAAFALELQHDYGTITVGKVANLFITKPIPSIAYIPYAYGSTLIEKVILNGAMI